MEDKTSPSKEIELTCFEGISDPRGSNARHPLQSVLFIALCAVISGEESWDDIELYALSTKEWLLSLLPLPHGLPSDDTRRRVLSALSPESFEIVFKRWVNSMVSSLAGDVDFRVRELVRQACEVFEIEILKGRSSAKLFESFPELKKRFWGRHFWARG